MRWCVLLAASFGFYFAWRPEYLLLLLLTTVSCHYAAKAISRSKPHRQTQILFGTVLLNLAILFVFKYYGLFAKTTNAVLGTTWSGDLGFLLPVGISFYTFQAIGYVADVYQRKIAAEKSLPRTTLFVAFFPQLVAGPIERASHLLPALRAPILFRWPNVRAGLWLILWGLFKKVVIADRLGMLVDAAYTEPETASGGLLLLATYAFAIQIYCDFSGYTDMAIGSAKIFGIDLMQNFRSPYLAISLRDFWSRWHISLSTWFRDYVYIPMGGNRGHWLRWGFNLLVVFAVSGLWHGAKWTYVVWGILHGGIIVAELLLSRGLKLKWPTALPRPLVAVIQITLTFHIVLLTWVFFRAASIPDAVHILSHFTDVSSLRAFALPDSFSRFELAVSLLAIGWMMLIEFPLGGNPRRVLGLRPRLLRRAIVLGTLLLLVNFGVFSNPTQFVYFQF